MTEFWNGFYWVFPALMLGMCIGYFSDKKAHPINWNDFGSHVLLAWAMLGVLALFSGFPVFDYLRR